MGMGPFFPMTDISSWAILQAVVEWAGCTTTVETLPNCWQMEWTLHSIPPNWAKVGPELPTFCSTLFFFSFWLTCLHSLTSFSIGFTHGNLEVRDGHISPSCEGCLQQMSASVWDSEVAFPFFFMPGRLGIRFEEEGKWPSTCKISPHSTDWVAFHKYK